MAESVPQKTDFEKAAKYSTYNDLCKKIITAISAIAAVYGLIHIQNAVIDKLVAIVLTMISLLSVYFSSRFNSTFRKAERTRRDGFLDNTFNTRLADIPSVGYYDSEGIEFGLKKLMSNLHESSLLTCKITERMFVKTEKTLIIWAFIIGIIILISVLGTQFAVAVINVFLSKEIIKEYLELKQLHNETDIIQQECKKTAEYASSIGWQENHFLLSEIIQVYLHYETALSYASIMLDSDIYNAINQKSTQEWEEIRKRYYQ